jgi:hypothetical protein
MQQGVKRERDADELGASRGGKAGRQGGKQPAAAARAPAAAQGDDEAAPLSQQDVDDLLATIAELKAVVMEQQATLKNRADGEGAGVGALVEARKENGEAFWPISTRRRVSVQLFNGAKLVSIREYYDKDGVSLPGKKGISLSTDQWAELIRVAPSVSRALDQMKM